MNVQPWYVFKENFIFHDMYMYGIGDRLYVWNIFKTKSKIYIYFEIVNMQAEYMFKESNIFEKKTLKKQKAKRTQYYRIRCEGFSNYLKTPITHCAASKNR